MRFTKSHLWTSLAWIVSTAGLVWQMHFICRQFLSYSTLTNVLIEIPVDIDIPSISITCELNASMSAANDTAMVLVNRFPTAGVHGSYTHKFITGRTLMTSLAIPTPEARVYKNTRNDNYHKYMHMTSASLVQGARSCNDIKITFGETWPSTNEDIYQVDVDENELIMTYTYKRTKKLPRPYSNCFNYDAISLTNCIRQCQNQKWLEQYNAIVNFRPFNVSLLPPNSSASLLVFGSSNNLTADRKVWRHCTRKCNKGDPCTNEFYSPVLLKADQKKGDHLSVTIRPPIEPNITTTHVPALQLTDLAVYVASAISFWLGMSPLAVLIYCGKKIKIYRKPDCQ